MNKNTFLFSLLFLLLFNSLGLAAQPVIRQQLQLLDQDYAAFRKSQVSNVSYALSVEVEAESDVFNGAVEISFDLNDGNISPITLDFDAGEILSLTVNGNAAPWEYERWFITVPASQFNSGNNEVEIEYRRPFSTDGDGLHKFTDPENGEVYLYTNFEPYNANRFFPMFDQPNLKAPFSLDVLVPENWEVISNMRESAITNINGSNHWQFPPTPPVSTYLYSFHAGPFSVWEDQAGDIALRLFARSSLAEYVNTDEWFIPTQQFMAFFQDYFDVPYPLNKYDQIVVPDFNPGAMENIGAVTFNEAYISRGEKSILERSRLAYVIAHEMAHMWFGDLVTMNWWNDLWLNESFATYMGYLALSSASEFTNGWDIFYSRDKSRAYVADDRVTTHPVAPSDVRTTADAFSVFDIITYQKGSSVLKQLPYFIGEENFRQGVSNYLKANSFGNATLDDFVNSLADSAGMDLSQWQKEWLQEAGANTVRTDFSCTDNTISSMRLVQSVPETATADKVLRSQRTLIGLYRYTDNAMVLGNTVPVTYSGPVTWVTDVIGEPCPDLVLPNENDHAYFEMQLDPISMETLREHINDFSNATTRLMLWESLWSSVRKTTLSLDDFMTFALANIATEGNDDVVRQVSGNLATAFNYYTLFGNQDNQRETLQNFAWEQLNAATPGSEIQKIWYDNFANLAHTPEALDSLLALLDGTQVIPGLEIDQDKRWNIVLTLNRYLYSDYESLLAQERANDPSDEGINMAMAAQAIRPLAQTKEEFLNLVLENPDELKLATLRTIMFSLFPSEQSALMDAMADELLTLYPGLNESGSERFLDAFIELVPATCTEQSNTRLAQVSDIFSEFKPVLATRFLQIQQADQRCVNIRNFNQ